MSPRRSLTRLILAMATVAAPLTVGAVAAQASGNMTYTPETPAVDTVANGPWTLSQGDPNSGAPYNDSLPTYTPGGTPTQSGGYPNLAVYPAAGSPVGTPYASGVAGTPGPVDAYCSSGGASPESGTQAAEPVGSTLPMSPYYFPFVTQTPGDPAAGPPDRLLRLPAQGHRGRSGRRHLHRRRKELDLPGQGARAEPGELLPDRRHQRQRSGSCLRDDRGDEDLPLYGEPARGRQPRRGPARPLREPAGRQPRGGTPRRRVGGHRPGHVCLWCRLARRHRRRRRPARGGHTGTDRPHRVERRCRGGRSGPVRRPQRHVPLGVGDHLHRCRRELPLGVHHRQQRWALGRRGRPARAGPRRCRGGSGHSAGPQHPGRDGWGLTGPQHVLSGPSPTPTCPGVSTWTAPPSTA